MVNKICPLILILLLSACTILNEDPGNLTATQFTSTTSRPTLPRSTPNPIHTPGIDPTQTVVSTLESFDSPAGIIRYATISELQNELLYTHFSIKIGGSDEVIDGPTLIKLPESIDSIISRIYPSPNSAFSVLTSPLMPGVKPYIFNHSTGVVESPYSESYPGGRFFGWHPDGRHFVFWVDSGDIWLVDAATNKVVTLAVPFGSVQGGAISPDGQMIAYIADNQSRAEAALWLVSSDGGDAEAIVDLAMGSLLYLDAWSLDGNRIVSIGDCPLSSRPTDAILCITNIISLEQIASTIPFTGGPPRWSPDGNYIAVTGLAEGGMSCDNESHSSDPIGCEYLDRVVYLVDTVSGDFTQLTAGINPVWSPDGSLIAFLSNRSGTIEIWTIRPDGTGLKQLTTDGLVKSPYDHLSWLPG